MVLTGCYAQRDPEGLGEEGFADLVIGNRRKQDLVKILDEGPVGGAGEDGCRVVWTISQERGVMIWNRVTREPTRPGLS